MLSVRNWLFVRWFWICYVLSTAAVVFADDQCEEGSIIHRSSMTYRCVGGNYVPVGCTLPTGTRTNAALPVGQTAQLNSYQVRCEEKPSSPIAQLVPVACVHNNKVIQPGESFNTAHFWYTCVRTNNGVTVRLAGCMDDANRRVSVGSRFRKNNFLFLCTRPSSSSPSSSSSIITEPVGCIRNGKEVSVGQDIVEEAFWYQCARVANMGIELKLMGCAVNGRKLSNKERYVNKGFLYECRVTQQAACENCPGVSSVSHDIVGCATYDELDNPIEHTFGSRWVEQGTQPQFKFTMECDKVGSEVKKRVVQCGFETSSGTAKFVDVRCMRQMGSKLVACISRADGSVEIQIHPMPINELKTIQLSNLGVSYC